MTHQPLPGFLGIDAGTQGLSAIFCDTSLAVRASAEGPYAMRPNLPAGHYEQSPHDWAHALAHAVTALRDALAAQGLAMHPLAVGLSGQMHGEVLLDRHGNSLAPARLWCDARNDPEADELTAALGAKIPKRLTVARWLYTLRHRPDLAAQTAAITTPTGYLFKLLTGTHAIGIGDASGMFPIDPHTPAFDPQLLARFDALAKPLNAPPLASLLPQVFTAGTAPGRTLSGNHANLPPGIPVAPPEGDQPAALAGALVARPGTAALSYGTSIVINLVGDKPFPTIHPAIDSFRTPDGKALNLVWMRNGTTFLNTIVNAFAQARGTSLADTFADLMPQALAVEPDNAGLAALPFMDDEPSLNVPSGGTACFVGLNPANATPAHMIRAALLASAFNLRANLEVLTNAGFPLDQIVLSGGLTRTPDTAALLADVFNAPVSLLPTAAEGTAFGSAVLAAFTHARTTAPATSYLDFHSTISRYPTLAPTAHYHPNPAHTQPITRAYHRHRDLLRAQPHLRSSP